MENNLKFFRFVTVYLLIIGISFTVNGQNVANPPNNSTIREFYPVSLDGITVPEYDYQRANKLPLTGYFEKSFEINGTSRTAKFYISSTAPIRSFFTVIAVPEGYNTTEFMVASGWQAIADKYGEGLVLLEPGNNRWGDTETELLYVNTVIDFYKSNGYFSIFGISYLIGYDGGGTALEAWAVANPLKVTSQAYVNSESLDNTYYSTYKTKLLDGLSSGYTPIEIPSNIKFAYSEVPVPTAYINSDLDRVSSGIKYWKEANDASGSSTISPDYFYGANVFAQSPSSDAWATKYRTYF